MRRPRFLSKQIPTTFSHILMNGTNAGRSLRASVQLDAIVPVSALVISLDYVPAI
jgi:hypothetical protein